MKTIPVKPHWARRIAALSNEQTQLRNALARSEQEGSVLLTNLCLEAGVAESDLGPDRVKVVAKGDSLFLEVAEKEQK